MSRQETATFVVEMTFETSSGELPSSDELEQLISDQMSGELDEETGLGCMAVYVTGTKEEGT